MSYIRAGHEMKYIKGKSDSYVIAADNGNGKDYIESYAFGDKGMAELLCGAIDTKYNTDPLFAEWFKKQVVKRLNVKLRVE